MKIITSIIALFFVFNFIGCSDKKEETTVSTSTPVKPPIEVVEKKEAPEIAEKAEAAPVVETSVKKTGAQLYAKCISCHGAKAEKSALNKSQVIQGWEAAKIASALKGYKDGSYGKEMKGIMKGQIGAYSDEEIEFVAEFISKL